MVIMVSYIVLKLHPWRKKMKKNEKKIVFRTKHIVGSDFISLYAIETFLWVFYVHIKLLQHLLPISVMYNTSCVI